MKLTAPRIADSSADWYPNAFKTLNAGLEYVLDSFPSLYKRTINEIQDLFSDDELKMMQMVSKDKKLIPNLAGLQIDVDVSNAINFDQMHKRLNINAMDLKEKLDSLSVFQAACLEIWIRE